MANYCFHDDFFICVYLMRYSVAMPLKEVNIEWKYSLDSPARLEITVSSLALSLSPSFFLSFSFANWRPKFEET